MAARKGYSNGDDPVASALSSFRKALYDGETPDPETFCRKHPECGSELREKIENFLLVVSELEALSSLSHDGTVQVCSENGDKFGPFKLLEELGRGGQGVVYLAEDTRLPRKVALKILSRNLFSDSRRTQRFEREARIAARLGHPAVCAIYESGEADGLPYIAMQHVKGECLARRIDRARDWKGEGQPFYSALARANDSNSVEPPECSPSLSGEKELRWTVQLIERVTRAVEAAHEAGIVHRDLKPANIMLTHDRLPVILDFGLARDMDGDGPTITGTHDLFGTPAYMAPEQIEPGKKTVDGRTDLYGVGATLHECLTGKPPFEAVTHEELYRKILCEDLPDPSRLEPTLPRDLAAILDKALAKDQGERYDSAGELADDLERYCSGRTVKASPVSPWLRVRRWRRRNPVLAGVLSSVCVVLMLGLCVISFLLAKARATLIETAVLSDKMLIPYLKQVAHEKNWSVDRDGAQGMTTWLAQAEPICERRKGTKMEGLAQFRKLVAKISDRRDAGNDLHLRSVKAHKEAWQATIRAIADERVRPEYRGLTIIPQIGLVPLGPDPDSGLFEFAHMLSGEIPKRDQLTGRLIVTDETGLVFVLLPGGNIFMGTFLSAEEFAEVTKGFLAPENWYPLQKVNLDPFLISKYEMTQAQWLRTAGMNPSRMSPGMDGVKCYTLQNPVENVSWEDCDRLMVHLGLRIPTDAQWEYAARGGTKTIWWTGNRPETLCGAANLTPRWAQQAEDENVVDDGFVHHAPVGTFRPNPFGLHDVCGNVREWVRERRFPSSPMEKDLIAGEGERHILESFLPLGHMVRGGGWDDSYARARSAECGMQFVDGISLYSLGIRPTMRVQGRTAWSEGTSQNRDE